ncbi:hypothetical protein HGRIS_005082 [Hohenbuehelia grisea]|uniref:Uncharacterized protein n=1 Tax=Hohenbuehelia grisea TaxID=104357 RepID=A0ABR3JED1_9AGAR
MQFTTAFLAVLSAAMAVSAVPSITAGEIDATPEGVELEKREVSLGNPDLVVDQGNRYKLNFGSTNGHNNACPGHYICYVPKNGQQHGDVSLGNPDNMVDEGNRYRLNFGSTRGHPNACDGHYVCYLPK